VRAAVAVLLVVGVCLPVRAGDIDPALLLDRAIARGEQSLRESDLAEAGRHYRQALFEGHWLLGSLDRLEDHLPEARAAFEAACRVIEDNARARRSLALVLLQLGEFPAAESLLRELLRQDPNDLASRQLLAQALVSSGRRAEAVQELEQARAVAPGDLELAFALARSYLALGAVDRAAPVFAEVLRARPIPQSHLLIGRSYRDFGSFDLARTQLRSALALDPQLRRAHYELGMTALKESGRAGMVEAIAHFNAELEHSPQDPQVNLELGVALVESQRHAEALGPLEIAARSQPADARTIGYLGRAQLGSGRADLAAPLLRRALELAGQQGANAPALRAIHLQLGEALRSLGQKDEAQGHFDAAQGLSAQGAEAERAQMARYLVGDGGAENATASLAPPVELSPLSELGPAEREGLRRRVGTALGRSYLNLGILEAQGQQFDAAAELLSQAAELDPELPRVQASLGIAYFNAKQYEKATTALARALEESPQEAGLRRLLALSWLNRGFHARAAELLKDDPELGTDPSLQFAYGMALVRSDRAAEAERVFSRLLARHGDSAELNVLLGQAQAQQGDFEAATAALYRALRLKPDVADGQGTLGEIYLKQGRLVEAEAALRAALESHPDDVKSRHNLALVLDQLGRPGEALPLLRVVLESKPDAAGSRYLLGKILLGQGQVAQAIEELEAAARLDPSDPSPHYQLGRAYGRTGRPELAQKHFELFRTLKDQKP